MEVLVDKNEHFPKKLADGFWQLGNYYFNLFLIQGRESSALVELGISAITDTVFEQLAQLRVKPEFLVMTHPHSDHITGLPGLLEKYPQARLIFAAGADDFIRHPKAAESIVHEDRFMSEAIKAFGFQPQRSPINRIDLPEQSIRITEKTWFDLGGLTFSCAPVGGHSPGSLMVHLPEHEAVIASDALGFHFNGRGFQPLYFTDYHEFSHTLEMIRALNPKIIGIGHQGSFVGNLAEKALLMAQEETRRFYNAINKDPREDEVIADELFRDNYRDEFLMYSPENIRNCYRLLVKRSR